MVTHWFTNILKTKAKLPIKRNHLFMTKDKALARVYLVKSFFSVPLEVQYIDVLENPMHLLTLDLRQI